MTARTAKALMLPLLLALAGCNGLFGGIYDDFSDVEASPYGFVATDADGHGGTIYVDATSYTRWVFLNLRTRQMDTVNTSDSLRAAAPMFGWDLALHRYDVRTHGGSACATPWTSVDEARLDEAWPGTAFVADADSAVVVDMSTMMEGYLGYAPSPVNPVLSQWLNVDTREMPPIYTLSGKVYALRLADGSYAALQFTNYINEASQKGYITIKYRYPLQ